MPLKRPLSGQMARVSLFHFYFPFFFFSLQLLVTLLLVLFYLRLYIFFLVKSVEIRTGQVPASFHLLFFFFPLSFLTLIVSQ